MKILLFILLVILISCKNEPKVKSKEAIQDSTDKANLSHAKYLNDKILNIIEQQQLKKTKLSAAQKQVDSLQNIFDSLELNEIHGRYQSDLDEHKETTRERMITRIEKFKSQTK